MRVAVLGAGAMGTLFAGRLAGVADVRLLSQRREVVEAIRRDGVSIGEPEGPTIARVLATTDPEDAAPADLALVMVKANQTELAAGDAARVLASHGLALTLQNGLGNLEILSRVLGPSRVWRGVTSQAATSLGPGRLLHAGTGPTFLENRLDIETRAVAIAGLFRQAGFETHLYSDLEPLVWGKLLVNAAINALTAVLRVPNGALLEMPAARRVMERVVSEVASVAAAKQIVLPYGDPLRQVEQVCRATALNRSSMLQDVLRSSPTEIDAINGAVVREADSFGLAAPANALLVDLIHAVEESYTVRTTRSEARPRD